MSQHDYVIANGTGAAVRSDLNNALAAIVSQNSGATAPATTYAYQWWADTTTGLLKIRNAANNAWVTIGSLSTAGFGLLAAGDTLTAALGSASTPGITFTGDLNTGIYSPGADQVAVATNGVQRINIEADGDINIDSGGVFYDATNNRLAIGTTSPTTGKLTLVSDIDPGTTAAGIAVSLSGVGGGTATAQYGIRVTGTGYNNSTNTYGVHSALSQQLTNPVYGGYFSATSVYSQGYGVYAETTCTNPVTGGTSYAGYFKANCSAAGTNYTNVGVQIENAATTGSLSRGLYVSTVSGPTTVIPFQVDHAGTERLRIDSSGRLLVGTSSSLDSNALLQVYKASGNSNIRSESASLSNGNAVTFVAVSGGRSAEFGVYKHAGITNPGAYLYLGEEDGASAYYWTDNSGNFRVSNNGDHIGTTSGTVVGTQTSDERLKNILGPVEYGLDTIKQIEPVRYALKSEPDSEKLGFIAQQVQPLIPQSVFDTNEHIENEPEDAPTKLGMEYVALIPVLVNAIKELSAEVDALKAQLS